MLNLLIKERLSGLLVVCAFNSEKFEEDRFDAAKLDLTKINVFINRAMSFMFPALMIIMNICSVMIVWFGAKLIETNDLMIGEMMAILQYAMHIIMSFLFIAMMFIMIPCIAVSMRRIGAVLKVDPSIKDPSYKVSKETAKAFLDKGASAYGPKDRTDGECHTVREPVINDGNSAAGGTLEFRNVSFSSPGAEEKTLTDISFIARPGQVTAFIGGTGSGKSTLISLIPRFYDVTEGSILLDCTDIRDIKLAALRDKIGYVSQKGVLFSGTIASNLKLGCDDASDEELTAAAKTAQAFDFISEKPEGMLQTVSQGGTNISGGQKQRLSIARALIKQPQIYIFDESFSALDFKTDRALRKALKNHTGNSTMQRINTIMRADRIIVLNEERIAGTGTHAQLMENCGIYK